MTAKEILALAQAHRSEPSLANYTALADAVKAMEFERDEAADMLRSQASDLATAREEADHAHALLGSYMQIARKYESELAAARVEIEGLKDRHIRLKKMVDEGSANGRMYSTCLEQEREIDTLRTQLSEQAAEITALKQIVDFDQVQVNQDNEAWVAAISCSIKDFLELQKESK